MNPLRAIGHIVRRLLGLPVTRITIHHEGGGIPRHVNLAYAGYSAAVYPDGVEDYRPPSQSWGTKHFNHVSYDIVLTGNRQVYAVTDADLGRIADLVRRARQRGAVAGNAQVFPHKQSFLTACPGDKTMARWGDVVATITAALNPAPVPAPAPQPPIFTEDDDDMIFWAPDRLQKNPNRPVFAWLDKANKRLWTEGGGRLKQQQLKGKNGQAVAGVNSVTPIIGGTTTGDRERITITARAFDHTGAPALHYDWA